MDLLDVSKENIQPLKRGRKISALNTALQAQTDTELHQQLMKEREEFEVLVRSYSGDDPLKPWYDYVHWVEQNFPKHGREGNLKVLLENCLTQFKDCEQYLQDVRFIDLWTRYMSFVDEPLEMYKKIHARGIGTQCAIFYQCWAEEYEQANDMKRADQIFIEGIKRNAQPIEELMSSHNNFQVRVARRILGENPINSQELAAERTALSTLRARGRKRNMVDSTRVGHSIKHVTPGVLRPPSNVISGERRNGNVQSSKLAVYNDENAPFTDAIANPQVKSSVSLAQQSANKENTLKPGRWNDGKFKKKSATSAIGITNVPAVSRNQFFQVHIDENSDEPKTPKTDIVVSNVLKARKLIYDDEKHIPIAIFEPLDPSKVPMYPKSKVYSGGTEFSLEELRAIIYLKREKKLIRAHPENEYKELETKKEMYSSELQIIDHNQVYTINNGQKYVTDHQSELNVLVQRVHISDEDLKHCHKISSKSSFEVFVEAEEEMDVKMKQNSEHSVQHNVVQKERKPTSTFQPIQTVPFSGCLKMPKILKERKGSMTQSEDEVSQNDPSTEQKDCDQSLTVNTKAVLNDVKGMWVSSPQVETQLSRVSFLSKSGVGCNPVPLETDGVLLPTTPFRPFKIFSDVSVLPPEQMNTFNVHANQEGGEMPQSPEENCPKMIGNLCLMKERDDIRNHQNTQPIAEILSPSSHFQNSFLKDIEMLRSTKFHLESESQQTSEAVHKEDIDSQPNSFNVYKDPSINPLKEDKEMCNSSVEIPYVPSPGMTHAQMAALEGTEDKENMFAGNQGHIPQQNKNRKSILQPSKDVYFVPLEQQLAEEEETMRQNPMSDETCCTENFAIPLVSSTPMVQLQFRCKDQEGRKDEDDTIDNTIALMNFNAHKPNVFDNLPPKTYSFADQGKKYTELPHIMQGVSVARSENLSTILELSERKKSSSMGTTGGSNGCKSTEFDNIRKLENITRHTSPVDCHIPTSDDELVLQEKHNICNNGNQNHGLISKHEPLFFFSDDFRQKCLTRIEFPSDKHMLHCEKVPMPLDNFRKGHILRVGGNCFSIFNISNANGIEFCMAYENSLHEHFEIEVKDNIHLWEQYIKEELRLRIEDPSMIDHFIANKETYIFFNKHLLIYNKCPTKNLKDLLGEKQIQMGCRTDESHILNVACEILNIVNCLHHCNITHGSLSLQSFMCVSERPLCLLLSNFAKAVDMSLLPADTYFDVSEKSLYSAMNISELSSFQIDYIALANIFHCLIFGEPLKVHKKREKWCISTAFPGNINENLWEKVFEELLNKDCVNLLYLRCIIQQYSECLSETW